MRAGSCQQLEDKITRRYWFLIKPKEPIINGLVPVFYGFLAFKTMGKYQWQGEDVKVQFGYSYVKENIEKPLWWTNFECHISSVICCAIIPAIKITSSSGQTWVNSNHFGIGVHKLLNGGWPSHRHYSLPSDSFTADKSKMFAIKEFNEEEFCIHEAARNAYQKKYFLEEYKKMEILKIMVSKKYTNG